MKGRKLIVLMAMLGMVSAFALAGNVSAAATYNLKITPAYVEWQGSVLISYKAQDNTTGNWTGDMQCTLTDPSGNVISLDPINNFVMASNNLVYYANWTYNYVTAMNGGTWSVLVHGAKHAGAPGGTLTLPDKTGTFTSQSSMSGVSQSLNDLSPTILYIAIVLVLLVTLVIVVNRVSGERGGKAK